MDIKNKKIYIYESPRSKEDGFIKIGETTRDVDTRIKEQFSSASNYLDEQKEYTILHQREAVRIDGTQYSDKDFHRYLISLNIPRSETGSEWFEMTVDQAIFALNSFESGDESFRDVQRINNFPMRKEQEIAVNLAYDYFTNGKAFVAAGQQMDFLWNAKMRFGKTFSAYQLMKKSNWKNTLVITYRPAVKKSWRDDLATHQDFKNYVFLSDNDILNYDKTKNNVVFMSFQELLVSKTNSNEKLNIAFNIKWDCIIIDEFHYGTSTENARGIFEGYDGEDNFNDNFDKEEIKDLEKMIREEAEIEHHTLKKLNSDKRLFLSGTPFKALTSNRFSEEQIFNWTYLDEQREKHKWFEENPNENHEKNPYFSLPQLNLYIYEISDSNYQKAMDEGLNEFSMNHFFRVDNKNKSKFVNEDAVIQWLNDISIDKQIENDSFREELNSKYQISKYPFSSSKSGGFRDVLNHTFWLMSSVNSCNAMANLLRKHPSFMAYEVIVAAGTKFGVGSEAIPPVERAISRNEKTITISCGKLTEGVSIKEWTAILFLNDISSPERYFQTAFRAQTPWKVNGKTFKKDCYVFDFNPSRSLRLLAEYSEKLNGDNNETGANRISFKKEQLDEFIRYLPVLKISGNGMVDMNANNVHSFGVSGFSSTELIKSFQSSKNFNVSNDIVRDIMLNPEVLDKCDAILNNIKAYRKSASISDNNETTVKDLGNDVKKLEGLKTKELVVKEDEERSRLKSDIKKKEKEVLDKRLAIMEMLKVLVGRIPLFMYLTHALEEDLREVLYNTQSMEIGLFRKTTGIEVAEFEYLSEIGLLKSDTIDSYISRFKELELKNFDYTNKKL